MVASGHATSRTHDRARLDPDGYWAWRDEQARPGRERSRWLRQARREVRQEAGGDPEVFRRVMAERLEQRRATNMSHHGYSPRE